MGEKIAGTISQDELVLLTEAFIKENEFYEATIFDEDMNEQDGYISGKYLESLATLDPQEIDKYNTIYKASGNVNLRDAETYEQKTVINEGDFVLGSSETVAGTEKEAKNLSGVDLTKVMKFDESGKLTTGVAASNYLEKVISLEDLTEVNDLEEMIVDTSADNTDSLNLRETPSVNGNKTGSIPTGTVVYLQDSETQEADGYTWQEVIYYNTETKEYESGWVANKFLREIEEGKLEVIDVNDLDFDQTGTYNGRSVTVSPDTNVIGIDIWQMSVNDLENFVADGLKNNYTHYYSGLDQDISSYYENSWYDDATSEKANVDYVIIKMGSSTFGIGNWETNASAYYVSQIEYCEANNIPYGLYYYSTCINEEEATAEAAFIKSAYQKLVDNGTIKDYNKLPFAIDVETKEGEINPNTGLPYKERQSEQYCVYDENKYGSRIEAITDAKVTLANLLEADNELGDSMGKTILYTSKNASYDNSTQIIDISDYNDNLDSGAADIWFVRADAISQNKHEDAENEIADTEDANVTVRQVLLDGVYTTSSGETGTFDIDVMSSAIFEEYINGEYQRLVSEEVQEQDATIKIASVDDGEAR